MALYFFNVINGQFIVDKKGTECSGMVEVQKQAIETAGAILKHVGGSFPRNCEWQMHVTDVSNKTVLKLRFSVEEPA